MFSQKPAMNSTGLCEAEPESSAALRHRTRPPPIRVLHVVNGEHYAGAERVQDILALRLSDHCVEVGFACLRLGSFGLLRQSRRVPLYDLRMRSRVDLRAAGWLARLIRREGYALVHTHGPRSALVGSLAASIARVPFLHHVHTHTHEEVGGRWMSRFSAIVERACLSRAAGLIGVSPSVTRYLQSRGYKNRRIWMIPNGVPTADRLLAWRCSGGAWTLGAVALFRPRKGIETLLLAISRLKAMGWPVRLRAVGAFETSEYEATIRQYGNDLGIAAEIDWIGFRSDVVAELRRMDIFVLPSVLSEGMPMSILEAMSVGVPVVATRVDGVTDVIRHGREGLLAEPGNAEDLARQLASVMCGETDGRQMRATARRRQVADFSEHGMAARVADVYREVLDIRSSPDDPSDQERQDWNTALSQDSLELTGGIARRESLP